MKFKKFAALGIVLVSAVALSACKSNVATQSSTSGTDASAESSSSQQATGEIDYTDSGYTPATLTVKVGQTITVKNSSSAAMSFNSDPHPIHTSFSELNLGKIDAGGSKTLTLNKAGTYTYHNHLKASHKGSIVVE